MKNIFIFIIFFICAQFTCGQSVIEGHVYDTQNIAIPYTSIYDSISGQGTYSDTNGHFKLEVEKLPLTLRFSNVGYAVKEVHISSKHNLKIFLEDKIINLDEIVVHASQLEHKYLGSPKKNKGVGMLHILDPFDQIGIIVNNIDGTLYTEPEFISFSIKIAPWQFMGKRDGNKPNGKKQLRLRMYHLNKNKLVGDDILHENIFLSPSKKGWYKINLEKINVELPDKGFVLAVEWIENNPVFFYEVKKYEDRKIYIERHYGIALRCHKMSTQEKRLYESVWLLHARKKGWEKVRVFKDYIPCFRLVYVELNENAR